MADNLEATVKAQTVVDHDIQVKELKENMAEWKPLVLGCSRLMLWEKPHEAAILVAIPTLFFSLLYFLEAGLLTTLSLCGLAFVVIDLGLPYLISYLHLEKNVTQADDDVIFERFCHHLVTVKINICSLIMTMKRFRTDRPPIFYVVIALLLVSLAWIGACINGVCLAYFATLGLVLYPGIRKHRLLETCCAKGMDMFKTVYAKVKSSATAAAKKQK